MKLATITAVLTVLLILFAGSVSAQTVDIQNPWARATVQGQMATGAFMTLTAKEGAKLVSVSSPVAGVAEVHEMKMNGDVMQMRPVQEGLALPAGKPVELKSSGYHVMLMDLKMALQKDTTIPMTLVFKDDKGKVSKADIKVPVSTVAPVR
jgi:copper(I)-binding protein